MRWLIKILLTPRWRTTDLQHAESSPCQWKPSNDGNGYTLSMLGTINAIATWFGICVVVNDSKIWIQKAWW